MLNTQRNVYIFFVAHTFSQNPAQHKKYFFNESIKAIAPSIDIQSGHSFVNGAKLAMRHGVS